MTIRQIYPEREREKCQCEGDMKKGRKEIIINPLIDFHIRLDGNASWENSRQRKKNFLFNCQDHFSRIIIYNFSFCICMSCLWFIISSSNWVQGGGKEEVKKSIGCDRKISWLPFFQMPARHFDFCGGEEKHQKIHFDLDILPSSNLKNKKKLKQNDFP